MWVKWLLSKYAIPHLDWFRLAQKPTSNWLKLLYSKLPRQSPNLEQRQALDLWSVGTPLHIEEVKIAVSPAPLPDPASDGEMFDDTPSWPCPACSFLGASAKSLQTHYDNSHAPTDPAVTTVLHSTCPTCHQVFVTAKEAKMHKCPVKPHHITDLLELPALQPHLPLPATPCTGWTIYTDGAGPTEARPWAGWGVAIWAEPISAGWSCMARCL